MKNPRSEKTLTVATRSISQTNPLGEPKPGVSLEQPILLGRWSSSGISLTARPTDRLGYYVAGGSRFGVMGAPSLRFVQGWGKPRSSPSPAAPFLFSSRSCNLTRASDAHPCELRKGGAPRCASFRLRFPWRDGIIPVVWVEINGKLRQGWATRQSRVNQERIT